MRPMKETTLSKNFTIVIGNDTTDTELPTYTSPKNPNQYTSPKSPNQDTDTVLPTTTSPKTQDRPPIHVVLKVPRTHQTEITSPIDRTQTPMSST